MSEGVEGTTTKELLTESEENDDLEASSNVDVKDANDYSRFDNVDDSDDEDKKDKGAAASDALSCAEAMNLANIMKDVGNTSFKEGKIKEALESYSEANNALTKLSDLDKKTSDVKSLLISLNGNKAMCYVKQQDWSAAKASASEVLKLDSNNLKALYRRGLAHHKVAALDEAKADLTKVISLDSTNAPAKKELLEVEKAIKAYAKKERAAMAGMFGGKSMYEDKEKERLAKIRKEEEKEAKLKDDWTKDKMSRRSKGAEELSFDDYKKEIEKEAKEKADEEKKRQEAAKKATRPATKSTISKPVAKKARSTEESDEEDEEVKELIKGYKTTSDGRKTSYFNNELDSHTKELIGDIAPKPISLNDSAESSFSPQPIAAVEPEIVGSAWNSAGTFEEKDMTTWAKNKLTDSLNMAKYEVEASGDSLLTGAIHVHVTNVKSVTGDAEIIASRGKRRFLFDFSIELEYEVVLTAFPLANGVGDKQDKKFKGSLMISDISPDGDAEYTFSFKKAIPPEFRERITDAIKNGLVNSTKAQINLFQQEYLKM